MKANLFEISAASNNESQTLDYNWSAFYSLISNFFLNCISVSLVMSAGLRVSTILKRSEQFGLQALGPDNLAILIVRSVSTFLSGLIILVGTQLLRSFPPSFDLFFEPEDAPIDDTFSKSPFSVVYIVFVVLAVVVNGLAKCVSIWANFQLNRLDNDSNNIFIISKPNLFKRHEQSLTLTLESIFAILIIIFVFLISSFAKRTFRLFFILPMELTFLCIVVPSVIIVKNKKMKIIFKETFIYRAFEKCYNFLFKELVSPLTLRSQRKINVTD
jgi:hypothetical protein